MDPLEPSHTAGGAVRGYKHFELLCIYYPVAQEFQSYRSVQEKKTYVHRRTHIAVLP